MRQYTAKTAGNFFAQTAGNFFGQKMRSHVFVTLCFGFLISMNACVTPTSPGGKSDSLPPVISKTTSLEEALAAGIEFGGATVQSVRKLVTDRKEWPAAEKILYRDIENGIADYSNVQMSNVMMLYLSSPVHPSGELFKKMVSSERLVVRHLAWQMATVLPGKIMRKAMNTEISRAIFDNDEAAILIPAMATAVQANNLKSAYSVVRQGLLSTNHEGFVSAMIALNPEKASDDLLEYLSLCPPEELRQLTITSIGVFAATLSLQHMMKYPPNQNQALIETIFYYAVSRNSGLSDLALNLVEALAVKNSVGMAMSLARMPVWVQISYIEGSRRNMSAAKRNFLTELKRVVAQSEVLEELGEINY
jgi:hypothetical protein